LFDDFRYDLIQKKNASLGCKRRAFIIVDANHFCDVCWQNMYLLQSANRKMMMLGDTWAVKIILHNG
jgi:hypothetical protein